MGIAFLALFINKFNVGNLILGKNYIEIPGCWKKKTKLDFAIIKNIGEINTYDEVIEIESEYGFHLIEKQWMKSKEFEIVREYLLGYQQKTTHNNRL